MMAAWWVHALVVGALASVAALAAEYACRALRRSTRWTWATAVALTAVLTALAPLRRSPDVTWVRSLVAGAPSAAAGATDALSSAAVLGSVLSALRAGIATPVTWLTRVVGVALPVALDPWLTGLWALCSAALLIVALAAMSRLVRQRRSWPAVNVAGTPVRLAPRFGPAVVGLARPEIVVPPWFLACTVAEQRLVLAHEREHVRARDPVLLASAGLALVLLPWHPLVWWMVARLRLAVEMDCDRRVLRAGIAPAAYGGLLLDLAGRVAGVPFRAPVIGVPALAHRTTDLERRILAMSAPLARRPRTQVIAGAALTLVAALAACESHLPTAAELERLDVAAVEHRAAAVGTVRSADSAIYVVDGQRTAAAEAGAIPAERIAAVSVVTAGTGAREVRIATRAPFTEQVSATTVAASGAPPVLRTAAPRKGQPFTGLVVIDGQRADEAALGKLAPNDIVSVDVLKADMARQAYPNEASAVNGVIRVTTRAAQGAR